MEILSIKRTAWLYPNTKFLYWQMAPEIGTVIPLQRAGNYKWCGRTAHLHGNHWRNWKNSGRCNGHNIPLEIRLTTIHILIRGSMMSSVKDITLAIRWIPSVLIGPTNSVSNDLTQCRKNLKFTRIMGIHSIRMQLKRKCAT